LFVRKESGHEDEVQQDEQCEREGSNHTESSQDVCCGAPAEGRGSKDRRRGAECDTPRQSAPLRRRALGYPAKPSRYWGPEKADGAKSEDHARACSQEGFLWNKMKTKGDHLNEAQTIELLKASRKRGLPQDLQQEAQERPCVKSGAPLTKRQRHTAGAPDMVRVSAANGGKNLIP
jgi:hypothetical protein